MSNDAFIFRNEVSDFAAVAFDSRQATVVRLKQLFNESGSTYTAINRYLEERRKSMDDATQGLTALLSWSTDFNGSAYNLAGSIAAALLGVALIFVVWALATKKENAKSYLTAWLVCAIFTLLFITNNNRHEKNHSHTRTCRLDGADGNRQCSCPVRRA